MTTISRRPDAKDPGNSTLEWTAAEPSIRKATRRAAPVLISLIGASGSGKTLTALKMGRGLVGPNGKLGVIDTEQGRASFYADDVEFDVLELRPPFSPAAYIKAISLFAGAGYSALVIDSISHEWEGIGGVLEMAEAREEKNELAKWRIPKHQHKKLINYLLQAPMHLILCCRAREKFEQVEIEEGGRKKRIAVSRGWIEIQEKNFIYEMTISMVMLPREEGDIVAKRVVRKCPQKLFPLLDTPGWLGEEAGAKLAAWIGGGSAVDRRAEELRAQAFEAAVEGIEFLKGYWDGLNKADKAALLPVMADVKASAAAADEERARLAEEMRQAGASIPPENPFGLAAPEPLPALAFDAMIWNPESC